jgi:TonB family protein
MNHAPPTKLAWHAVNLVGAAGISMTLLWGVAFVNDRFGVVEKTEETIRTIGLGEGEPDGGGGGGGARAESNDGPAAGDMLTVAQAPDALAPTPAMPAEAAPEFELDLAMPNFSDVQIGDVQAVAMPQVNAGPVRLSVARWTADTGRGSGAGSGSGQGSGSGTGTGSGSGSGSSSGSGTGRGGGGGGSGGTVDQPPREIYANARPEYPAYELQQGIEGKVVVQLLIDESGRVADVKFVSGSESFRAAIMAVVWRWRFSPAVDEGKPLKVWVLKPYNFVIPRG